MNQRFKIVDLFAGPGGLAEGFTSVRDEHGNPIFDIALSVEMERSAFATLRMRSFFRKFQSPPDEYYAYISGRISRDELIAAYPQQWDDACNETRRLELGDGTTQNELYPVLDRIKSDSSSETILIGGPPCQAYSLVGRARNRGLENYDPAKDARHFLYEEYIRIIERLRPAVFVMENVKGMLSSTVKGERIFDRVVNDLRNAGGRTDEYTLVPLVDEMSGRKAGHVIRCEDYGIPQRRHRVILMGVRRDHAVSIEKGLFGSFTLRKSPGRKSVLDAIGGMSALRSGLSRCEDGPEAWRKQVVAAFKVAATACQTESNSLKRVWEKLLEYASVISSDDRILDRICTKVTAIADNELGAWISDPKLEFLPNHETRGHMSEDLARYAFCSVFAEIFERSAKSGDFPRGLAPKHRNWKSGKFADRFRVQAWNETASTVTSHISKDGHYFIHPDPLQCRSLTVREAARLQTFPDNYFFEGNRTQQYVQVGNAVPPLLAKQIGEIVAKVLQ